MAVLAHWGVDYLGSVYTFFGQSAFGIPAGSTSSVYVGQYLVDLDMTLLFGAACFILVVYLGVRKFAEGRRRDEVGFVDKGLGPGGGLV